MKDIELAVGNGPRLGVDFRLMVQGGTDRTIAGILRRVAIGIAIKHRAMFRASEHVDRIVEFEPERVRSFLGASRDEIGNRIISVQRDTLARSWRGIFSCADIKVSEERDSWQSCRKEKSPRELAHDFAPCPGGRENQPRRFVGIGYRIFRSLCCVNKTSIDRILFAVVTRENESQGVSAPFPFDTK